MKYVRLRTITERLASGDSVSVLNLADELGVSPSTVRRDLQSLAASGILLRVHGGAAPVDGRDLGDRPFDLVADEDAIDKGRIAGRAATLVNDGDVVLLDIGTTTRLLARELFGRPITAVTSSLAVLDELRGDTTSEVVLLGGAVRRQYHSLVGSLTEDALRQVRAATVFLSASGVSSDGAVQTPRWSRCRPSAASSVRQTGSSCWLGPASSPDPVPSACAGWIRSTSSSPPTEPIPRR